MKFFATILISYFSPRLPSLMGLYDCLTVIFHRPLPRKIVSCVEWPTFLDMHDLELTSLTFAIGFPLLGQKEVTDCKTQYGSDHGTFLGQLSGCTIPTGPFACHRAPS